MSNQVDQSKEIKTSITKNGQIRFHIYDRIRSGRWLPIARAKAEAMLEQGKAIPYNPKTNNLW